MDLADYLESLVNSRIWTDPAHIEQRLVDAAEARGPPAGEDQRRVRQVGSGRAREPRAALTAERLARRIHGGA